MHRSGWCTAPIGARPQHEKCRSPFCTCECGCAERNTTTEESAA